MSKTVVALQEIRSSLPIPEPRVTDGALETHVLYVDTFGNVKLTALQPQLVGS